MGRSPCCSKVGLRKGPWSTKEDSLLANYIQTHGEGQWRSLPKKAGLLRCGKSCRLRWMNYLRPGIKRGNINQDEEDLIVRLHGLLGNRWSLIAGRLPGRTDNEIKNYWNTHLLKKLKSAADPKPSPKPKKSAAAADPKPSPKPKKSAAAKKKKNNSNKHKKSAAEAAAMPKKEVNTTSNEKLVVDEPPKTKVYLPKPIRVSPAFSRSSSYDSLASGSGASNSDASEKAAAEVVSYFPGAAWPPLFESNDADYVGGDCSDDLLSGGFILPILNHCDSISGDVNMLDKVYDEYLQLL